MQFLILVGEKVGLWVLFAFCMAGYHAAGSTYDAAKGTAGGIMDKAGKMTGMEEPKPTDPDRPDPYGAAQSELEGCKD